MIGSGLLRTFTDRTARKPEGRWARKNYSNPREHRHSFKIIMETLCLNEDDIYCEIGCGGGALLSMAMARAGRGKAIDHSQEMVELSIENNRRCVDEGRLEVLQGNAEQLPWESDMFTACASANMFFFVEKPQALLSEVFRVMKQGGRFSMVTIGDGFIGRITFGLLYSLRTYSDSEMTSMLLTAGFSGVKVKSTMGLMQVCYGQKA